MNTSVPDFLCISPRKITSIRTVIRSKMSNSMRIIYDSLDSILTVFKQDKYREIREVQELLNVYEEKRSASKSKDKKHPLIILEGLDGSGKTTVGDRFAKKIGAVKWKTPPESISGYRLLFDNHKDLRTPYYCLGNYIAAFEIQKYLGTSPVVMDRYWHSTAAFAIAQVVQDFPDLYQMPPEGDTFYCWPEDLFKPDIVMLLDVSEEVRIQRQSRRTETTTQETLLNSNHQFRKNVIQAYRNMYNPSITFINGDLKFDPVLQQLLDKTRPLLHA